MSGEPSDVDGLKRFISRVRYIQLWCAAEEESHTKVMYLKFYH